MNTQWKDRPGGTGRWFARDPGGVVRQVVDAQENGSGKVHWWMHPYGNAVPPSQYPGWTFAPAIPPPEWDLAEELEARLEAANRSLECSREGTDIRLGWAQECMTWRSAISMANAWLAGEAKP